MVPTQLVKRISVGKNSVKLCYQPELIFGSLPTELVTRIDFGSLPTQLVKLWYQLIFFKKKRETIEIFKCPKTLKNGINIFGQIFLRGKLVGKPW